MSRSTFTFWERQLTEEANESRRPDKSGDQDLKVGPRNKCSGRRTETPVKLTYLCVGGVRTMGKTLIVGFEND